MKSDLELKMLRGASWFYWIAGLVILQLLAMLNHIAWGTSIGLGILRYPPQFMSLSPTLAAAAAIVVLLALGYVSGRPVRWTFVLGILLYGADGVLFLMQHDYFGVVVHIIIIYFLWNGLSAANMMAQNEGLMRDLAIRAALQKDREERARAGVPPPEMK